MKVLLLSNRNSNFDERILAFLLRIFDHQSLMHLKNVRFTELAHDNTDDC